MIEGAKLIEGLSKALVLIPGILHYGQVGVVLLDLLPGEFPGPRNVGKDVSVPCPPPISRGKAIVPIPG